MTSSVSRRNITSVKKHCKLDIKCIECGIYYVYGALFPIQLIIINRLSETDNFWLSRLRANLDKKIDIEPLISAYSGKEGNNLYEAAIAICIQLGASRDIAFKNLCENFSLTESQAEEYLQKYWTEKSA